MRVSDKEQQHAKGAPVVRGAHKTRFDPAAHAEFIRLHERGREHAVLESAVSERGAAHAAHLDDKGRERVPAYATREHY